jgi:head-tail adaptor
VTPRALNRLLVLEERNQVPDGSGGYAEVWAAVGSLWADVQLRSGRDAAGGDVALGVVSYRIVLRGAAPGAPSRPRAGQRFREGTRFFAIRAVAEEGPDGRFLICFADEEVAS